MKNNLYFILLGSLFTTLASYSGFFTLILQQKIFIFSLPLAILSSFLIMYFLSVILWSYGLICLKTLCNFSPNLKPEKAFLISFFLIILKIALIFILFKVYVFDINLSWWVFIFPVLPLLLAQIVSVPLIKRYQNRSESNENI